MPTSAATSPSYGVAVTAVRVQRRPSAIEQRGRLGEVGPAEGFPAAPFALLRELGIALGAQEHQHADDRPGDQREGDRRGGGDRHAVAPDILAHAVGERRRARGDSAATQVALDVAREGIGGLVRRRLSGSVAIMIMGAALLTLSIFSLVTINLDQLLQGVRDREAERRRERGQDQQRRRTRPVDKDW